MKRYTVLFKAEVPAEAENEFHAIQVAGRQMRDHWEQAGEVELVAFAVVAIEDDQQKEDGDEVR